MIRILTNKMRIYCIVLIASFILVGCNKSNNSGDAVCVKGQCYSVEIAADLEAQATGLMHRDHLDRDSGMLFIFSYRNKHAFWMKNTLISLDMIWLDYGRHVVHIEEDVPPCKEDPCPRYRSKFGCSNF